MAREKTSEAAHMRKYAGTIARMGGTIKNRLKDDLRDSRLRIVREKGDTLAYVLNIMNGFERILLIEVYAYFGEDHGIRLMLMNGDGTLTSSPIRNDLELEVRIGEVLEKISQYRRLYQIA